MDTLAKRLKNRREALGLSQVALAKLAKLNQSDISKLERGSVFSSPAMWRIARALNCSPAWLEDGEDQGMAWQMGKANAPLEQSICALAEALRLHSPATRKIVSDALVRLAENPDEEDFSESVVALLARDPARKGQAAA